MTDVQKFYFSFQDGIKRFETAMHGLPDRVPVYAQIHDFARKETGISSKPLIRDRNDLKNIKTPDFKSDGRLANVIAMYALFYKLTGTEPVLHFCAPFTLAANIRRIERLVRLLSHKTSLKRLRFY